MKKRFLLFAGVAFLGISLASCSTSIKTNTNSSSTTPISDNTDSIITTGTTAEKPTTTQTAKDPEEEKTEIVSSFEITTSDGTFTNDGGVYTITSAGTYILSGKLSEGQIQIQATEAAVELDLNGVEITSTTNSPIYCTEAESLKIKAIEDTYNEINDNRSTKTEDIDTQGEGAIYAKCDLKLVGKGSLVVSGSYNNGIHTSKDLSIKNVTLKSTAYNNSLKGNDSITVESGNITAISTGGDGLKTEDSDISSKGNQRGIISITGGVIDIYSCCDGIDASYNAEISGEAVVNIYTNKYSTYSGSVATVTSDLYIRTTYSSQSYRFAAYFYNENADEGKWVDATYSSSSSSQSMGGRPGQSRYTYYYHKLSMPSGYKNVKFAIFNSTDKTDSFDGALAVTTGSTINTSKDMFAVSGISSSIMSGSWETYTVTQQQGGPGGMSEGNSNKSDYSAKGIKADNEVLISGGTITIKAYDDGIHASAGANLENGSTGLGNVTVSGGYMEISSADDGIHADSKVNINGGTIDVITSYEGIEGNLIYINAGKTTVSANDDGLNASSGSTTPCIYVNGGYLDVTVGTGDVDGIDSNGAYVQKGGFVIARNGTSMTGGMAAALDTDGSVTITGGTFISVGPYEQLPTNSQNYVLFGSSSSGGFWGASSSSLTQFKAGSYTVSGTSIAFTLSTSYNGLWICSDELVAGTSYTITGGTEKTWTQSSGKTQVS